MIWSKFLLRYAAWALGIGILLGAALIALDPYDTGRFALFGDYGVPQFGQRMADASLGRTTLFNAAIIGNSTLQMIDPARMNAAGVHAVSLTIPGTGPREQLAVAAWFVRHHPGNATRALVIGIDRRWCAGGDLDPIHPFPFWLYGDDGDYLLNLPQLKSLEAAGRKIGLMLGVTQALAANGYNDYDTGRAWEPAGFRERLKAPPGDDDPPSAEAPYHFTAVPLMKNFLGQAPANAMIVLAMPPRFHPEIGMRQSEGAAHRACHGAFEALAAARPHTYLIDFLTHGELTSREDDFWDRTHYRARVAREMEQEIRGRLEPAE